MRTVLLAGAALLQALCAGKVLALPCLNCGGTVSHTQYKCVDPKDCVNGAGTNYNRFKQTYNQQECDYGAIKISGCSGWNWTSCCTLLGSQDAACPTSTCS